MSIRKNKNLQGIALMMLAMLLFQSMDAMAKWLVGADLPAIQVIAVRSWIMLSLGVRAKMSLLRTRRPLLHAARGLRPFFTSPR